MGSEPPLIDGLSCILSYVLQFSNKKWGSPSSFFSYYSLKLNLKVFSTGHIVAMVTCYIKRMTVTCLPMIRHLHYTVIVLSFVKQSVVVFILLCDIAYLE